MAFKKPPPTTEVPDSPDQLFLNLPRRKIPDVLPHQRDVMRKYVETAEDASDVALQLPTGSGKTLVGLLIAEWRRRKNRERVVYLCPNRQLVNQVVSQSENLYGLTVVGFTGRIQDYDPDSISRYQTAENVVITTGSSLFNTNPFFKDADVIIVDDAHAAESYVADLWSVTVNRLNPQHSSLHASLCGLLRNYIDSQNFKRLSGELESVTDWVWVDKIPTPIFTSIREEIGEILDVHANSAGVNYSWSMIRENLHACHLYLSSNEILLRPLIPPTWTHLPFTDPTQRIYMSATLGSGGELERLMGRRSIKRLPIPEGWDRQGVGRRFFIFPSMSLSETETAELRNKLMIRAGRSLVLVPSDRIRNQIASEVENNLGYPTFDGRSIESSKTPFTTANQGVAIVANRYDGIDFPGDECRLLFVDGLPKSTNIQERFLMNRMGCNVLFYERIQTRVLQAIGRCTRSLEDYSAVVITGDEIPDYLVDIRRRRFLHPEIQAEIQFGIDQSKNVSLEDIMENFDTFLENEKEWEEVNQQIVDSRRQSTQENFPAVKELNTIVGYEVEFQEYLWQGDFEGTLEIAERIIGGLSMSELRGYRALWHYLVGSAAWLGANSGVERLLQKACEHYGFAKRAAPNIPWLVPLSRFGSKEDPDQEEENNTNTQEQIERIESIFTQVGTLHDRKFASIEKDVLEGLNSKDKGIFEEAHKILGKLIGFDSGNVEVDGSPDPWWMSKDYCFVFEDHAGAKDTSILGAEKARQVAGHPNWILQNLEGVENKEILPVLITPVSKASTGAIPHLQNVSLWSLNEFRDWAKLVFSILREIKRTFVEPGDLEWRANAFEKLTQNGMDAPGLFQTLQKNLASDLLKTEK